jgi:NADH dehydrogenase/NADH:ubiquinone oxidoreductase subunit G
MINLTIDNKAISVEEGTTVLEACKQTGISIPTLCYLEKVQAIGACRVCLVEVQGVKDLVASCVMPVSEKMVVQTNNRRVREARKLVVELLLS